MSNWQPIETALDGHDVVVPLFHLLAGRHKDGMRWIDVGLWNSVYECWQSVNGELRRLDPTHWMPLPKPPSEDTA